MGYPHVAAQSCMVSLRNHTIGPGKGDMAHVEEVLQAPRRDAGVDERRDAVRQLPDGVSQQVEQSQSGERDRCPQLIALSSGGRALFRSLYLSTCMAVRSPIITQSDGISLSTYWTTFSLGR